MRRRSLIAALSTLGSGLLAGCLGSTGGGPTTTTSTDGGIDCPRYSDRVETVVCTPDLDDPEAEMAMRPVGASGSLPETDFAFTLANERESAYETNFYAWRLQKHVDGAWFHVAPQLWPEPLMSLDPDDSHTWQLTVDNTDLDRSLPRSQGTDSATVVGLGGGTYSFGVEGRFANDPADTMTAFVTRFDLEGPELTLRPTPGVEDRVRDGDAVRLTWRREEGDPVTYRVTELKSVPDEAVPVIAEQVIREDALRNAIALFERWTRFVEIETSTAALSPGAMTEDGTILYRGTAYRIETDRSG